MEYIDRVYGEFEIREPAILELIMSAPIQRLKDIDQGGYRPLWLKPEAEVGQYDHSRFAHSLGVYLLLNKHGAPLEEQIAGLIHDVSHSAFSHCIDYVLSVGSEKEQSHQDNIFENFVLKTEIPQILQKHGFNASRILDDSHFPLKEKNLPDLCADRIDYSLRTAVIFGELNGDDKKYFLDNLSAENNSWIFKNFKSAEKYAELFLKLNTNYYAGLPSAVMFRAVGDYLRYALSKNYISETDLYTTDKIVLEKIEPRLKTDSELNLLFDRMNKKIGFRNDPDNRAGKIFCKSRVINPLCRHNGKIMRVSDVNSDWNDIIRRESKPKKYFLKFDR